MFKILIFLSLLLFPIWTQCPSNIFLAGTCCPAENPLLLLCGDGTCESQFGETPINCPYDCQDPSTLPISWTQNTESCENSFVYYPTSLDEIKADLKESILRNEDVKVWGAGHSDSFELCSDGNYMVLIGFNTIHGIENFHDEEVVKVDAGVIFSDLTLYLFNNQKSLSYALPEYGGMTLAGFLANDGHGSNAAEEGSDIVTSIRSIDKMDQRNRVTTYSKYCTEKSLWKALMSDQGMLGITVGLRIKIRDLFNIEIQIFKLTNDDVFKPGGIQAIADNCTNFMFVDWFLGQGAFFVTCGTETTKDVSAPDAWNRLIIPDLDPSQLEQFLEISQEAACNNSINQLIEAERVAQLDFLNWVQYTLNGQVVTTNTGVGYAYRMLEVTLDDFITNGIPRIFPIREFEVGIPETMVDEAITYMKSYMTENNIIFPILGVLMRVGRYNDDSWLGESAIGEEKNLLGKRIYYFEFESYYPFGFTPDQYQAYDENVETMIKYLVKNYKGKLHTGKNLNDIWSSPEVHERYSYVVEKYQEFVEDFDPFGVFSNDLAAALGIVWPKKGQKFSKFYYFKQDD